ncbi:MULTISPECIES: hypothetical protein [Arcobacteraceae]|uniref:Lipoprotein n=1 Tax=Poseidonibacter parvus TaxID=1850254 RepID=A0A1P8KJB8_9BACT|nr:MULTISPECIES: hypothetical protein [Arcobacteraceae]APW64649.1 hypothetical protein LPB137_01730 [Poseidonibacter parvus]
MLKSIFLLITTVILFTGCHRLHPIVSAAVIVPAVIISPFVHKPYHRGYYNHRGYHHRGYRGHRR